MTFIPSPQQAAVLDWVRTGTGSAFVEAVAGAGKTTTLIESVKLTRGTVAFCAYNTKIAGEIGAKVAKLGLGNRIKTGTFHSFGLGAWRWTHKGVKFGPEAAKDKARMTAEHLRNTFRLDADEYAQVDGAVTKLIGLAKQRALGLFGAVGDDSLWFDIVDHFDLAYEVEDSDLQIDRVVEMAQAGLRFHNQTASHIVDFDDMIYQPVVRNCNVFGNDWVLVDESQDTNPARRALTRKMLKPNGRAMFVGDERQAIYGFTGADADAIDQIKADFNTTNLPLTTTFRCPQAVVRAAQQVVSHIQAADSAPEGSVTEVELAALVAKPEFHATNDAILCRKTAPLVDLAYTLIRKGVACHVEGRDIGLGLLKLVNRFDVVTTDGLADALETYAATEVAKLIAKGKETAAEALQDRVDTILVVMDGCPDVDCVRRKIATMFLDAKDERRPTLTLSTVHRAKGREWQRVFILGRNLYMPSKWARQAWQQLQEANIEYVAITRAMHELVFVNVPQEEIGGRPTRH
jgi:superfamily I DNA/RNA helicase